MSEFPPVLNANAAQHWEADRIIAREEIINWLADTTSALQSRSVIEAKVSEALDLIARSESIEMAIFSNPSVLTTLRALTRRDIGTSQTATFLGLGTSALESIEREKKPSGQIAAAAESLLLKELDQGLVPWILENRTPTGEEKNRSTIIAADRILRRSTSTELRYKHEPRQLEKMEHFLKEQGYTKAIGNTIVDPRKDMDPGTYAFRVNIEGTTVDGLSLKQNVDTLIMPKSKSQMLPIFLEAKSMTDEVNPNKRQKEEAQKVDSVRRRWQPLDEKLNFILLLGGTVPRRYLEVEANSGLDWVWEHRVEDLLPLLDWFRER